MADQQPKVEQQAAPVAEAAPPQQAHEVFQHLKGLLAEKTSNMQQLLSVDLLTLKELAQKANIEFFEE